MYCHKCPAGFPCIEKKSIGTECSTGEYSPLEDDTCHVCGLGNYCPTNRIEEIACADGTYQNELGKTKCIICSEGKECGNSGETPCPPGEYSNEGESTCKTCPEGFTCAGGTKPSIGPTGKLCAAGAAIPDCTPCPTSSYCPTPKHQLPCPPGTISTTGQYCRECPPGEACPSADPGATTTCNGANEYSGPGETLCQTCGDGEYCPYNWNYRKGCPVFAYKEGAGTVCSPVLPGFQLDTVGSAPTPCASPTHYSTGLSQLCTQVPGGYGLLGGGLGPVLCGFGTLGVGGVCTSVGANKESFDWVNSYTCPYGYYSSNNENRCRLCPAGYKCNTDGTTTICGVGFYSPEGELNCEPCTAAPGAICPLGSGWPQPCPAGSIDNGANECDPCTSGYSLGSTNTCSECPMGFYCPYTHSYPIQCPLGHYSSSVNSTSCTRCSLGYRCYPGSVSPTQEDCPAGYYCTHTLLTGEFYLQQVHPCPAGYQSTLTNYGAVADCNQLANKCALGYYCPPGTYDHTPYICPPGHVCPLGTTSSTEHPCDPGTYNKYEGKSDKAADCLQCPGSHYCPIGCAAPIQCPIGYDCSLPGKSQLDNSMFVCQTGEFPRNGSGGCIICPKGAYCPVEQMFPTLCPVNIYIYIYIL